MDVFFYAVPGLIITVVVFAAVGIIRRSLELRHAWNSGLTAEARCLRTYTKTSGGAGDSSASTTLHHVYEFRTREGREVRFDESGGPSTVVEGDIVTVHYAAERPEKATAHAPSPVKAAAGTIGMLVFFGVIVVFCIGFMVTFHTAFASDDPFAGMP
ncbi:DUF3592 domain-containing protein [Streptomyces sp. NPDC093544]|jgi:hypothetical protein|uniref:DUF3592 domain-containing protein n=1 Tax=Streptomyces sp. NPDC093544 TaxID=3155200 RepID=UPI003427C61C